MDKRKQGTDAVVRVNEREGGGSKNDDERAGVAC